MANINMQQPNDAIIIATLTTIHQRLAAQNNLTCSANSGYGLLALVADALFQMTGASHWQSTARCHLASGVELLASEPLSTSFYRSAPGFGWVVGQLWRGLDYHEGNDVVETIASTYNQVLEQKQGTKFDLIDGLAGLSILARVAPKPLFCAMMDNIWLLLQQTATTTAGFAWIKPGIDDVGADLGLAHGSPGVMAALAAALTHGWDNSYAAQAAIRGGHWLRKYLSMVDDQLGLPYNAGASSPARLGWCYGLPSSAICFAWLAALEPEFQADVIACGHATETLRGSSLHGINDACICHGEASWAYIGPRLIESLGDALPKGFTYANAQADQVRILACEQARMTGAIPHHLPNRVVTFDTILEGAAGVWLALAGLQNPRCRAWEAMMLLDFPNS